MGSYRIPRPTPKPAQSRRGCAFLVGVSLLLLFGARSIAGYLIEYQWWKELGQLETWFSILAYGVVPVAIATVAGFAVLWLAHARGVRFGEARLRDHSLYAWGSALALLLLALLISSATLDTWTLVRWAGSHQAAQASPWRDPAFGRPLSFYLFDLPFYTLLRRYLVALVIAAAVVYWAGARIWQLSRRVRELREMSEIDPTLLRLEGGLESVFLRGAAVLFLVALAARAFLGRYEMVLNDHGFMVGVDYVDANVGLPVKWMLIVACLAGATLVAVKRWIPAGILIAAAFVVEFAVPGIVAAVYVRPNEISLEKSYINDHIHATRSAFHLEQRVREVDYKAKLETHVDPAQHKNLLDNVRLWDWRAFHDTVTQIQALRPYYVFRDTDVDRYTIDGRYQQVLLSPRELDIRQLGDARARWINPHFIYTHGYGLVMAEVSRITSDGLPVLMIQNAPPEVNTPSLKLTRPELYYGEALHEPVFVRTAQEEFNYPSGSDNVHSRYEGKGGFPVSSFPIRAAAALQQADFNILLTGYLREGSRMIIRRNVADRLSTLASFITWDPDPYLVVTPQGRMVWMADGYTVSNAHPFSRSLDVAGVGDVNYIRNSVKATVDAYDGTVRLYVFDPTDPIILAYRNLFPKLFVPASEMPPELRAHARYPETLFRVQAEIYRTYHMLDPQSFYNKEDLWDVARSSSAQTGRPEPMNPTYVMAALPGSDTMEFLLLMPFTPRSKDNLIGLMVARCDGENLGEIEVLKLSKQALIFGPMQIAARVNQDQNISKDLTLWNQQGSQVLRGQMLVLPVEDTFLYVESIYIQSTEARMPQLKKVMMAMGNRLIYTDTYEQAVAQLANISASAAAAAPPSSAPAAGTAPPPAAAADKDIRIESIRNHLRRYRELMGQGKWAEAGRELEAIESEAKRP